MTAASCATGRSLVPAVTTNTFPIGGSFARNRQPQCAGQTILLSLRKEILEVSRLIRVQPRDETILSGFAHSPDRGVDPRRSLAFGKDNFREAASFLAVKIEVGESEVADRGLAESCRGRRDLQCARPNSFE